MIEFLFATLAVAGLAVIAGNGFLLREQQKLLREIRKFAALYPPYPTTVGEDDLSSVKLDDEWNEKIPGRD